MTLTIDQDVGHFSLLPIKTGMVGTRSGSEAFFNVGVSRVRRSGSRKLYIISDAASPLPLTVFFQADSQALSKSICADCKKSFTPCTTGSEAF